MLKKIVRILPLLLVLASCSNTYDESRYSIIVSKNDKVVLEEYYNGKTEDSLTNVQSLTKGVISILIGIAIEEKFTASENESIEKYFPNEFKKNIRREEV